MMIFDNLDRHLVISIWQNLSNRCWIVYSLFLYGTYKCWFFIFYLTSLMSAEKKFQLELFYATFNKKKYSRVKWSNPGKGKALSPTPRFWSSLKESLRVTLDYSHQLYFLQGQQKKKWILWKTKKLSTIVWYKTGSDDSRKITPASKTNQDQRDLLFWKMKALLKMVKQQLSRSTRTLSGPNLVLHEAPSIDTSISSFFWTHIEILKIRNSLK